MFYNDSMPISSFFEKIAPERLPRLKASLHSLFERDNRVIGLDIGSASVKLVQLRFEKERALLETYGEVATGPYQNGPVGTAVTLGEDRMAEMIQDVWREAGAKSREVIAGIPLRNSFVTFIDMPHMSEKELARAIPFEARKYIPLPLSEVEIEWWPVSPLASKEEEGLESVSVLLAAVQKETINAYQRVIKKAKLSLAGFEIEIFSVARVAASTFRSLKSGGGSPGFHSSLIVLDIGAHSTKIAIVDRGALRMARAIDKGSQAWTLALSHALGIDFERAEAMKRDLGIKKRPETEQIRATLLPLIDAILDEARRFQAEYERKYQRTIDKVVVAGGGALLPGFLDYAIEYFRREVFFADAFAAVSYPPLLSPVISQLGAPFAQAVGLALRGAS